MLRDDSRTPSEMTGRSQSSERLGPLRTRPRTSAGIMDGMLECPPRPHSSAEVLGTVRRSERLRRTSLNVGPLCPLSVGSRPATRSCFTSGQLDDEAYLWTEDSHKVKLQTEPARCHFATPRGPNSEIDLMLPQAATTSANTEGRVATEGATNSYDCILQSPHGVMLARTLSRCKVRAVSAQGHYERGRLSTSYDRRSSITDKVEIAMKRWSGNDHKIDERRGFVLLESHEADLRREQMLLLEQRNLQRFEQVWVLSC